MRIGTRSVPESDVVFANDRKYRYYLSRTWDEKRPRLVFIMLNPSTADENANDQTVARCEKRALKGDYGGFIVLNLFAIVSTDRSILKDKQLDIIGAENDDHFQSVLRKHRDVVVAWGAYGEIRGRADQVMSILEKYNIRPKAIFINRGGSPRHPLYLRTDSELIPYRKKTAA